MIAQKSLWLQLESKNSWICNHFIWVGIQYAINWVSFRGNFEIAFVFCRDLLDISPMKLTDLPLHQIAEIVHIEGDSEKLNRLTELGFRSGKQIQVLQKTPFNGPIVIQVQQSIIALRSEEAVCITLKLHL